MLILAFFTLNSCDLLGKTDRRHRRHAWSLYVLFFWNALTSQWVAIVSLEAALFAHQHAFALGPITRQINITNRR